MTNAWNRVYGTTIAQLPTTHLYVRFAPISDEEFKLIDDAVETQLYDYPLEYEVLVMGDYYPQTGLGEEDWPYFYAVVKPGFISPISGFTILEHLVLLPDDTYVVADAHRATGNLYTIYLEQSDGTFIPYTTPSNCQPGSLNYPFCLVGETDTTVSIPLPCEPLSPIWPDCYWQMNPDVGDTGNPEDPGPSNACGCPIPSNIRNPAGCIQVRNTNNNQWEGVRQVKVIMKNKWFSENETWTNHQGCFFINKRYSGEAWTWVRFKSSQCQIRGWSNNLAKPFHALGAIKDYVGKRAGPVFNNYLIQYDIWNQQNTNSQKFWGAATVNNALYEFHDMPTTLGIAQPPHIDIWVGNTTTTGYALMKNYINLPLVAGMTHYFLLPWKNLTQIIILGTSLLPDVKIGIDFTDSRLLKRLAYHEIAHSSHFQNLNAPYWYALALAESLALGWGDQNSADAGRIAICESWSDHIQFLMEAMRFNDPFLLFVDLEQIRNFNEDHVPIGLHFDLQDFENDPLPACDWNFTEGSIRCGPINDNISGLSTAQLFNILTADVTNPLIYRNKLESTYGVNSTDLNNIFVNYLNTQ
jgi:hypothetical protein